MAADKTWSEQTNSILLQKDTVYNDLVRHVAKKKTEKCKDEKNFCEASYFWFQNQLLNSLTISWFKRNSL